MCGESVNGEIENVNGGSVNEIGIPRGNGTLRESESVPPNVRECE